MKKLLKALIKAQKELDNCTYAKTMLAGEGNFAYKYMPLDEIIGITKPILTNYGLVVIQTTRQKNDHPILITKLYHKSGQFITSEINITYPKNTDEVKQKTEKWVDGKKTTVDKYLNEMQELGKSITYLRRYALLAILGIQPQNEDFDANMESVNIFNNVGNNTLKNKLNNAKTQEELSSIWKANQSYLNTLDEKEKKAFVDIKDKKKKEFENV